VTNPQRIAAALFAAAAAAALPLAAQQPAQVEDSRTITAKIESVDLVNRTVTLKGKMGRIVTLKVDPGVKNFAQVKTGDEVVLKYAEALSVKLEKSGAVRSAAAPGAKPAVALEQQTVIVASVEGVDPQLQEVLLKGPLGRYTEVKVKDPAVFKAVRVGDKVQITYTEALVIDVHPHAGP